MPYDDRRVFADFPETYEIAWHETGSTFWLDWFLVPKEHRRKGEGRAFYRAFEVWLMAEETKPQTVRLFVANTGDSQPSGGFWMKMGYTFDLGEGYDGRGYMRKVVQPLP
jgi:GNAT superfamily N-acetyltransferase